MHNEFDKNATTSEALRQELPTRSMSLAALFAVLTGVGANIRIPFPMVPLTLQTVFVLMSGLLLGPRQGALSMFLYMTLGLFGLPFFAGGGGIQSVLSPSFGFIVGFIPAAWVVGKIAQMRRCVLEGMPGERTSGSRLLALHVVACLAGIAAYDVIGVFWLYGNLNWVVGKEVSFYQALGIGLFPFLIPDLIKLALVVLLVFIVGTRIDSFSAFRK